MKKNQQTKHRKPNKAEQECGSAAAANVGGSPPDLSGKVIRIDEGVVREHLDRVVVRTVEETLNALLQAEADALCGAKRYEHSGWTHAQGTTRGSCTPRPGR